MNIVYHKVLLEESFINECQVQFARLGSKGVQSYLDTFLPSSGIEASNLIKFCRSRGFPFEIPKEVKSQLWSEARRKVSPDTEKVPVIKQEPIIKETPVIKQEPIIKPSTDSVKSLPIKVVSLKKDFISLSFETLFFDWSKPSSVKYLVQDWVQNTLSLETVLDYQVGPYVVDLYVPSLQRAFCFNDFNHHCVGWDIDGGTGVSKTYHSDISNYCLSVGVKLYQIWNNMPDNMICSLIRSKLGKPSVRLYARKCKVSWISNSVAKKFNDINHLDKHTISWGAVGLIVDDLLVSVLSFRTPAKGNPGRVQAEFSRYCSLMGYQVIGGFSKLLKFSIPFLLEKGYSKIISYTDKDLAPSWEDTVYNKAGMFLLPTPPPIERRYVTDSAKVKGKYPVGPLSRPPVQKWKLAIDFPEIFDANVNGNELRARIGIYSSVNAGNWKFGLDLT
jgi:hypothetical protein